MRRIWSSILLGVVGWIGGLKDCKKELWKKGFVTWVLLPLQVGVVQSAV